MTVSVPSALMLLAELEPEALAAANRLRAVLAPEASLRMSAHCALFRHLPGPSAPELAADIGRLVRAHRAPVLRVSPPRRYDRSIAIPLRSDQLLGLRDTLAQMWAPMLLPLERAQPRLHITLASGLDSGAARAALDRATAALRKAPFMDRLLTCRALLLLSHQSPGAAPLLRAAFPG